MSWRRREAKAGRKNASKRSTSNKHPSPMQFMSIAYFYTATTAKRRMHIYISSDEYSMTSMRCEEVTEDRLYTRPNRQSVSPLLLHYGGDGIDSRTALCRDQRCPETGAG